MSRIFVTLMIVLLAASGELKAADLSEANDAYQRGDWERAVTLYTQIVESGVVHEDLYYNLGNAAYRAGRLGLAIFNYERALRLDSGAEDARYNLEIAREAVAQAEENRLSEAERDAWWVEWSLHYSMKELTLAFLGLNLFLFVGLLVRRFLVSGFLSTAVLVLSVFLGVGTVVSGALFAGQAYVHEKRHNGIIIADGAVMREGPDPALEERGRLHPGLRITLLGRRPNWLLIRLANGVEGWVPERSVGLFR